MSKRIENAHRRLLPLTLAAFLLAAALPRLSPDFAGDGAPQASSPATVKTAGFGLSLGFYGHHGRFHYGHHRHYRPYYFHRPYDRYYYPHSYYLGYRDYPVYSDRFYGRLDLDVKPKKTTQVYVDGNYVGVAGSYDGWPEYLWLEKDSYELIFYNPGYETIVRHVEVRPGAVLKIREEMRPGESIRPEELTSASSPEPPRYGPGESRTARRAPSYERRTPTPSADPRAPGSTAVPGVTDARPEPARIQLSVAPADATVYLDGRFLGVAGEIGEARSGILIDPGEHVIEVVRPGYSDREVSFEAEPGDEVKLEIELEPRPSKADLSA